MEITLLVARLVLALVFVAAGAAKAADLAGTRKAAIGFGVPPKLAAPLGSALPFLEILVGLALLPRNTVWPAAVAALGLLLVFATAIAINLARGRAPYCNCFGQLHSKPVSGSVLARDLLLAAVAALIVVVGKSNPSPSVFNWLADLKSGEVASLALSIVACGLLAISVVSLDRIRRQQSSLLATIAAMKKVIDEDYAEPPVERAEAARPQDGLPVGALAPSFSLPSIDGEQFALENLLSPRKPVLLLFVSHNCSPCKAVLESVEAWERDYRRQLTIVPVARGDANPNGDGMVGYGVSYLLLQKKSEVADQYEAKWTPAAVLISPSGRIASQVAYGYDPIRDLVTNSVRAPQPAQQPSTGENENGHKPRITVGTPDSLVNLGQLAPSFSLPDMYGKVVGTEDLLGRDTLLVFWDPKCPFCQAMADAIRAWEQNPPKRAPRLVFISSGDLEDVKADSARFKAQFLYDSELSVGLLFGTNLTPSAVLIDADGRIASGTEGGRPNILALAGIHPAALPAAAGV